MAQITFTGSVTLGKRFLNAAGRRSGLLDRLLSGGGFVSLVDRKSVPFGNGASEIRRRPRGALFASLGK